MGADIELVKKTEVRASRCLKDFSKCWVMHVSVQSTKASTHEPTCEACKVLLHLRCSYGHILALLHTASHCFCSVLSQLVQFGFREPPLRCAYMNPGTTTPVAQQNRSGCLHEKKYTYVQDNSPE